MDVTAQMVQKWIFQSTLSLRRATTRSIMSTFCASNFNPRSPCGERPRHNLHMFPGYGFQSTLSLRRATRLQIQGYTTESCISIHALLAESDPVIAQACDVSRDFNPRSPCGERRVLSGYLTERQISIHALLAESDRSLSDVPGITDEFQSTLSLRRATD